MRMCLKINEKFPCLLFFLSMIIIRIRIVIKKRDPKKNGKKQNYV